MLGNTQQIVQQTARQVPTVFEGGGGGNVQNANNVVPSFGQQQHQYQQLIQGFPPQVGQVLPSQQFRIQAPSQQQFRPTQQQQSFQQPVCFYSLIFVFLQFHVCVFILIVFCVFLLF